MVGGWEIFVKQKRGGAGVVYVSLRTSVCKQKINRKMCVKHIKDKRISYLIRLYPHPNRTNLVPNGV